jgi:CsoR family transcriptional regulator, copper-sensing transcriptional repressor
MAQITTTSGAHRQTKSVVDQLARTAGHVSSIKRMVEEGRPCPDVLVQIAAVKSALNRVSRLVLEDHIESCLIGAVGNQDEIEKEWERLKEALDRFVQ